MDEWPFCVNLKSGVCFNEKARLVSRSSTDPLLNNSARPEREIAVVQKSNCELAISRADNY